MSTYGDQDWLAIESVYRYDPDIWRSFRAAYRSRIARPFVLIESAYEGEHLATPARIRRQAWWAILSGGCGQFFGNNPIWYFDGPGYVDQKAAATWREALDLPGSKDMSRLAAIFGRIAWQSLVPDLDDALVRDGGGGDVTKVTAAWTADRTLAVLYVPSDGTEERELTLDLSSFPGQVDARWFNPARDEPRSSLGATLRNEAGQAVRTPGDNGTEANDWVLVLQTR